MENITDALKMAAAALIFIVAFSVTMVMFSQARQTTDAVVGGINVSDYLPKVEAIEDGATREVGIETVIPTLYRYAQSDSPIRVRIVSRDGKELQVFDQGIESDIANSTLDKNSSDYEYLKKIDEKYNNQVKNPETYMYGAPWKNNPEYRLERVNAYINGTKTRKMSNDIQPNYKNNYLKKYTKFTEYYTEYRTDGEVLLDDYGEEIVIRPASTKIIITYKVKDEI